MTKIKLGIREIQRCQSYITFEKTLLDVGEAVRAAPSVSSRDIQYVLFQSLTLYLPNWLGSSALTSYRYFARILVYRPYLPTVLSQLMTCSSPPLCPCSIPVSVYHIRLFCRRYTAAFLDLACLSHHPCLHDPAYSPLILRQYHLLSSTDPHRPFDVIILL